LNFDFSEILRFDLALAVNRNSERIHDATEKLLTDRNLHDLIRALHRATLFDKSVVAQNSNADRLFFEVEDHARNVLTKVDHFARHRVFEAIDFSDPVTYRYDR